MNYQVKRQTGLTLVELMIATTLSLVLLGGVLLVFSANKTTYQMQNGLGTLQENGRYAMRQISADLQMAGFGGCLSPHIDPRIVVLASSPPTHLDDLAAGEFFAGRNDETGGFSYDGGTTAMYDGRLSAGTDSIEIRGALRSSANFVADEIATTGAIEVQGTVSSSAANPYFFISDCSGADIFAATGFTPNGSNTDIAHGASDNTQADLSRSFAKDAVVMELATHTYFVADTGRTNPAGDNIIALYRFDGTSAQELVDGVEDLQIEYALDTDDNGTIDAFADPGGVANWNEVMAVRISLLLNSVNAASGVRAPYIFFPAGSTQINPPTTDLRLRQEFTALVSVRNSVL